MEVGELKVRILESIGDLLGEYTFSNKLKEKAIAIDVGGKYPPKDTKTTGLECVIIPQSELSASWMLGDGVALEIAHRIELKQWDLKEPNKQLMNAVQVLAIAFGNDLDIGPRLIPVDELGIIESCSMTYTNYANRRLTRNG